MDYSVSNDTDESYNVELKRKDYTLYDYWFHLYKLQKHTKLNSNENRWHTYIVKELKE